MSEVVAAKSRDELSAMAKSLGLLERELAHIEAELGRLPNSVELTIFAGMWSEHCSYKSTRQWLASLPRESWRVLAGPGSHAGVVEVGDGWAVAFKIESHNHPSAVEPYQGAATGVGGILRDIIAQGARPTAVLDALCFGDQDTPRTRHLQAGIVGGIAGYGNAFGVPNIGGKTTYDPRYDGNPLVNALAAGLLRPDQMRHGRATGPGNLVLLVGATTGRDGILGAAFASEELSGNDSERRSHVQVGDPYEGKKLLEACLSFTPKMGMVACQDLGACGLTCAAFEMAAAGDLGMEIDLGAVPLREAGMSAHEIMLSESQERFLFIITPSCREQALAHFRSFGVHAEIVGVVTEGPTVVAKLRQQVAAELPAQLVAGGAPLTNWPLAKELPAPKPYPPFGLPRALTGILERLLGEPGTADLEKGVWGRYDQTVGNRTVRGPAAADAAVQKLPNSRRGYALVVVGRGEVCATDPYLGTQAALADALRALACTGAEMVAITDGLNMGSPRDPVENLRIAAAIHGLGDGLTALGVPVTGGNVSLYNESPKGAIPPTPLIGALGVVEDVSKVPRSRIAAGEVIFVLGSLANEPSLSRYGRMLTGEVVGPAPEVNLPAEKKLATLLLDAIDAGLVRGATAAGAGGLAVALAKLCVRSGIGVKLTLPELGRPDWLLFGEYPAQAWVSIAKEKADAFTALARRAGVPHLRAGIAGGDNLVVDGLLHASVASLKRTLYSEPAL